MFMFPYRGINGISFDNSDDFYFDSIYVFVISSLYSHL